MTGNDKGDRDLRDDDLRDDDLRARFAELRSEEEAQAPQFALPSPGWAEPHRRWSAGKIIAAALCLVTITAAVFLLRHVPPEPPRNGSPVASLAEWRSPTDFLLETPGREVLRTVPAIGMWHDYTKTSGPEQRQKHPQARKQVLP